MMKAVLIDPFNRTISMIEMGNDWREISARIGCQYFTVAGYYDNDVAYCDDEGLLYGPTEFVMISGFGQPLAGRVLMLGSTADGDSTDVNTNAVEMMDKVQFLSHEDVMEMYA
jgi:hypothetical protein